MSLSQRQLGERPVEGHTPSSVWLQTVSLYRFAAQFASGCEVLDVACGTGYGCRMLLAAGARRVLGVDVSRDAVDYARARYGTDRLDFRVGDARDLTAFGSFDLVVSIETIEHVPDGERCVAAAARALRSDGLYVVSTPNCGADLKACRGHRPLGRHHQAEYDAPRLQRELRGHFREVEMYGHYWRGRSAPRRVGLWLLKHLRRDLPVHPLSPERLARALPRRLVAVCRRPLVGMGATQSA
ncbi:MAG: methyltransferase domain-containing protein [Armatimonadota bacterium]